jgi:8-hydroxy-5-deazaflavin:NADPH oxidoreductase
MKIGIIGIGAIGGEIAKKLSVAGHQVKVSKKTESEEFAKTAKELGAVPASIYEVVKDVQMIIISIPTKAISELPKDLFLNVPNDVIIVDTSNYYPFRDGKIEALENGKVESVWVSGQVGRPIIKAFNNVLAYTLKYLAKPSDHHNRIAIAVSGDNAEAKKVVSSLIDEMGFDAVDAGILSESWRHQPGTPAYCTELNKEQLKKELHNADKNQAPNLRELVISKIMSGKTPPSHEEMVELNRSCFSESLK